ncbi:CHAT domain-containing protein [Streptomyces mirabilis]
MGKREKLLAAVWVRVDQAASGDWSAVLEPAALAEARSLEECVAGGPRRGMDMEAAYTLGWLRYRRSQALPPAQAERDRNFAVAFFTGCFVFAGADDLPQPLLTSVAEEAFRKAIDWSERAMHTTGDPARLTFLVELWKRIARNIPDDHPNHVASLSNLGSALQMRFERVGQPQDLDEAVEAGRAAVRAIRENHPDLAVALSNLASVLVTRLRRTAEPADMDEVVEVRRAAVRATPDNHPSRASRLSYLGDALRERSKRTRELGDLDEAVEVFRGAIRATPEDHPSQAGRLSKLGAALRLRFECTGVLGDLDEAVDVGRAAVRAAPDDRSDRVTFLANLGDALHARFKGTGDLGDLDEAVETVRTTLRTLPDDHPDRAMYLFLLGRLIHERFERTGDLGDLGEAVGAFRAAVRATPHDGPDHASYQAILGTVLQQQFDHNGDLGDLDEAVEAVRAALRAAPKQDPDKQATHESFLGTALRARFERTGDLGDLDDAVRAFRAALRVTPDRASYMADLGDALRARFKRTGDLKELDQAVEAIRGALRVTPDDHPDRASYMADLGDAFRKRFERTGDLRELDEAVEVFRAGLRTAPDDQPSYAKCVANLEDALRARFKRTGDLKELDQAVEAIRGALRSTPDVGLSHALYMSRLSVALQARFERTGDLRELDEAVDAARTALRATSDDHPIRPTRLSFLGAALYSRFEHTATPEDRDEALSVFEQVIGAATSPPVARVRTARFAARLAASSDPARAAALLEQAVLILPEVAPRRLGRSDQLHAIGSNAARLAEDATALALADTSVDAQQRAARALRLAEAGRAVLLSQALDTRSDLTDLRDQHPDLAERFSELRELLDQDPAAPLTDADRADGTGRERHRLAQELEKLLKRIRACDGFAEFGLPPTADDLLGEAAHGPVVIFNISRYRSDALLLTRDGITSRPLPQLTPDAVLDRANSFYRALSAATAPDGDRIAAQQTLRQVLEWLWEAAAEPALSALAALGEAIPPVQDGQPLPRVWWAPGGLLGLLPLHAAGFHTDPGHGPNRRTVLDRVISSYTPTIRTLRHARRHRPQPADDPWSLIVAMPTTPGLSPLPHVPQEARRIQALLPRPVQLTEREPADTTIPPNADTPTTAAVLACLPHCSIAHFACHGASNRTDPSQSQLFLHDHATAPLTVSALAQVNLDRAQLAYLSACSTADPGNFDLLDQAIHLTSAFQLAGFPHVVGTLWPIDDRLAVEVAESFYTHLTAGPPGTLDLNQAAAALHHTIRSLRDRYPATPSLWAAYLHAGA